jgi:hypothetical protein
LFLQSLEAAATAAATGRVKMPTTTKEWKIPIITLVYLVVLVAAVAEGISHRV